jgi:hypothetical protein
MADTIARSLERRSESRLLTAGLGVVKTTNRRANTFISLAAKPKLSLYNYGDNAATHKQN